MCGKGSQTTTQTTTPNPVASAGLQGALSRAQSVASLPYQPYGGELTADVNAQQYQGIGGINANAGYAQPYIQQAAGLATQGATPLTAADIQNYQNPYTQQVVNATQAQFANSNAEQQQQVLGNAAMQGALGGDRVGVAQAELARQQNLAQNPVIAGLYSQGFSTAANLAEQQKQAQAQGAYSIGNLGISGQGAALQGAGAQVGAGSLEQQTQQARDTAQLQQFQIGQAFPYQQAGWLAGITSGLTPGMGGTTTTTQPPPNPWSQIAGLGLGGLGVLGGTGAFGQNGYLNYSRPSASGGRIPHRADGGIAPQPYGNVQGYIPQVSINPGRGMTPGGIPQQQQSGSQNMMQNAMQIAGMFKGWNNNNGQAPPAETADVVGSEAAPIGGAEYPSEAFGGAINPGIFARGYADGGTPEEAETDDPMTAYAGADDTAPQQTAGIGRTSPDTTYKVNPWLALASAGFGMAASPSPFLGTAIGQGGQAGIANLAQQQQVAQKSQETAATRAMAQQRINQAADQFGAKMKQTETHQREQMALERDKLGQEQWVTVSDAAGVPFLYNRKTGETKSAKAPKLPSATPASTVNTEASTKVDPSGGPTPPVTDDQKETSALAAHASSRMEFTTPLTENQTDTLNARNITPEQFNFNAMRYALGDVSVVQGMTGKAGAQYRQMLQARAAQWYLDQGMTPREANMAIAEFGAMKAGARTLGTQEARMTGALEKTLATAPIVIDLSKKIPRTDYPTLNSIYLAALKGTGNKDVVQLKIALETLASNYGSTMGMGNSVLTDFQTKRAQGMLESGYSHGQLEASVGQIIQEIQREKGGIKKGLGTFLGQEETGIPTAPAKTLSDEDKAALDWASKNPSDPRATEIKRRHGVQ